MAGDPSIDGPGAAAIGARLQALHDLIEARMKQDDTQQKAFDHLYEELRQYKDDFVFQQEKPFLLDLLLFYDSLNWFQQSLARQEMSSDVIADSFQYLLDEFLEMLYRRDVVPCESIERFDRKLHKAVRVVAAPTADDDWKVQAVLKRGFVRGEKQLRAEEVAVARFGIEAEGETAVGVGGRESGVPGGSGEPRTNSRE
ncbi:MAG: nucleotide exchange factor GrpE [Myxococcales bacterium]|nr:nucleotide exchange factor GrpE [Myxococcales bacterium]